MSEQEKILKLRKMTNLPLLKCRKALIECNWDVQAALDKLYKESRSNNRWCFI